MLLVARAAAPEWLIHQPGRRPLDAVAVSHLERVESLVRNERLSVGQYWPTGDEQQIRCLKGAGPQARVNAQAP